MVSTPQNDVDFTPHFSSRRHTQKLSSWNHSLALLVWHGMRLAIHKSMTTRKALTMDQAKAHKALVEYRDARLNDTQGTLTVDVLCSNCGILQCSQVFIADSTCYCEECQTETTLNVNDVDKMHYEALTQGWAGKQRVCRCVFCRLTLSSFGVEVTR